LIKKGEEIELIDKTKIYLKDIILNNQENFQSLRAIFVLTKKDKKIGDIEAGKNYYFVSKTITTEVGIFHDWLKDIYFVLGNQENDKWSLKIYLNPLVNFIWLGVLIMVYSGIIGILKK